MRKLAGLGNRSPLHEMDVGHRENDSHHRNFRGCSLLAQRLRKHLQGEGDPGPSHRSLLPVGTATGPPLGCLQLTGRGL